MYGVDYTGGSSPELQVNDGYSGTLGVTYAMTDATQQDYRFDNVDAAGIGALGTWLWGDDITWANAAGAADLDHPIALILPQNNVVCNVYTPGCVNPTDLYGTNYATGVGADGLCHPNDATDPSNCFIYGDILVYTGTCPASMDNPTMLICKTLQKRGLVLEDTSGTPTGNQNIRSGLDVGLVDRISSSAWTWMKGLKLKGNFYVIDRCSIVGGISRPDARGRHHRPRHPR